MRTFVVMCLVAVAFADKFGYNYHPVGHSNSGLSVGLGSGSLGGGNSGGWLSGLGSLGDGSNVGIGSDRISTGFDGIAGGSRGSIGAEFGGNNHGGIGGNSGIPNGISYDSPSYNTPAELEKQFYTFSAPEVEFDDADAAQKIASSVKQGLRVIFIKGPENNGLENAAIALAKHSAEQKTAIYVLNKQPEIGDLATKLNAINKNVNNKPEVHFVKYRTSEDAANAQKAIQSQYDSLGGSSNSHNGGIAPVLNFASQAPVRAPTAHSPGNSYLPSSIFRFRN